MSQTIRKHRAIFHDNIRSITPSYLKKLGLKMSNNDNLNLYRELEEYVKENIELELVESFLSKDNSKLSKYIEDNDVNTEDKFKKLPSRIIMIEILQKKGCRHGNIKSETAESFRSILIHLTKKFVNIKNEE